MPRYQNLDVDLWVHRGKLGVAQPSVCLFHRRREDGKEILEALAELECQSRRPEQRVLTFKPCFRAGALRRLKLKRIEVMQELRCISIRCVDSSAVITMSSEGLGLLKSAVTSWLGGAEDFGVAPGHSQTSPKALGQLDRESGELWFWGPSMEP